VAEASTALDDYYRPDLSPEQRDAGEGMWRWRRLLPLDGSELYPLQVGGTPLINSARLCREVGLPGLFLKDETRSPTGSNKDRATALCLTDALRRGAPAVAAASSGNVAVSLAAGAAAVGLPAYLFVSRHSVSPHKVGQMRAYGATVFLVDGPYEVAYRLSEAACQRFGWYSRNTASNPLALQAKKTVAFEVWEQLGRRMPSVVYIPVGDGVTLVAFALGCEELVRCGLAERVPRLIGVQASGAAPLARAFAEGLTDWKPVKAETVADGIAIGDPFYGRPAIEAVRRTGGEFVCVTDEALMETIALLARTTGLLAEPAGAAALAGVIAHRVSPQPGEGAVVALVTGTGLKDQRWLPRDSGRALEVPPDLDAIGRAVNA
jgi:threonine synthase